MGQQIVEAARVGSQVLVLHIVACIAIIIQAMIVVARFMIEVLEGED